MDNVRQLRKYNPNTTAYFNIPGVTLETITIDEKQVVAATYTVVDGGI